MTRPPRRIPLLPLVVLTAWAAYYELACTAAPGLIHTLPSAGIAPDVLAMLGALTLVAAGLRGSRGWLVIGIGSLCWASGDVYWTETLSHLSNPPVPSWADAGYLTFCPLAVLGTLLLVRDRVRRAPRVLVLDSCAAALAVGGVCAAVVLAPVLDHTSGGLLSVATNVAYPLVDMLLLAIIVGAVALSGWRLDRTLALLGAAVLAFWVADSLYLLTVASSTYSNTSWFNPLWYASPVIMGWSAWLPTRGATQQTARTTNKRRIVMPLMFSAIALGTLVWGNLWAIGAPAVVLSALSLLVVMGRLALTWRENNALLRTTQVEAQTDALTGLANRRALSVALASRLDRSTPRRSLLALFDLDGFKQYNDTFGHPAGDTLLQRLAAKLQSQLPESATAFRIGGDEFCVLIDAPGDPLRAVAASVRALSEGGEGFAIGASHGSVLLPQEAHTPSEALQIADSRMYAQKHGRRLSASRQSRDVLLRALAERNPELGVHVHDVGDLARACASSFGLRPDQVEEIGHAAELHDVGKVAIPDAILNKPAALDDAEWAFIRRHTLIGQRITGAAPALERVALLVRSTHENVDGSGYPDGLAGDEIPLGSRIIAVCDAYDAMTTDRPYRRRIRREAAMAELRRCAGTQFDPQVVERFCAALQQRAAGSGPQLHVAA